LTGLEGFAVRGDFHHDCLDDRYEPFVQARFRGTVWHDREETEEKQKGNRRIRWEREREDAVTMHEYIEL
jgi:hypothetical protein